MSRARNTRAVIDPTRHRTVHDWCMATRARTIRARDTMFLGSGARQRSGRISRSSIAGRGSKSVRRRIPSRQLGLPRLCSGSPAATTGRNACLYSGRTGTDPKAARPQGKRCRSLPDYDGNKHMCPACLAQRSHRAAQKKDLFFCGPVRTALQACSLSVIPFSARSCASALPLAHVLETTQ